MWHRRRLDLDSGFSIFGIVPGFRKMKNKNPYVQLLYIDENTRYAGGSMCVVCGERPRRVPRAPVIGLPQQRRGLSSRSRCGSTAAIGSMVSKLPVVLKAVVCARRVSIISNDTANITLSQLICSTYCCCTYANFGR